MFQGNEYLAADESSAKAYVWCVQGSARSTVDGVGEW